MMILQLVPLAIFQPGYLIAYTHYYGDRLFPMEFDTCRDHPQRTLMTFLPRISPLEKQLWCVVHEPQAPLTLLTSTQVYDLIWTADLLFVSMLIVFVSTVEV